MGISLNTSNAFTITDSLGNTKFSLDYRMPHIIHNISSTYIEIPKMFKPGVNSDTQNIDRVDEIAVLANTHITSNLQDSMILPFFKISGGYADTNSKIVSGTGSVVLRRIVQATSRELLGTSILNIVQENDQLKLVCNQQLDRSGFANYNGDDEIYISYRIYYVRFR